jgi:glycosyltransferase involved in cell wall biosynthesis
MNRWHILDAGSIWLREFASALAARVPVTSWQPEMRPLGALGFRERIDRHADPALEVRRFPLQRGYWRYPVSTLRPFAPALLRRISSVDRDPDSILVVTTPYYAPVAERWPGTVVYYLTDFTAAYDGADEAVVRALDRRLCQTAAVVCPNSQRIADYLVRDAGCDPAKITVVPQATRAANLYATPPTGPEPLPADVADLARPVAGVIGNLAANMDWVFLEQTILRTPELTWLLVGPSTMPVALPQQRAARERLIAAGKLPGVRIHFAGGRTYGELQRYARALDVAVLPYHKHEPTYSGSSTRFYEHLAACRPMIATEGFAELLSKEPLLRLTPDADSAVRALNELRSRKFDDGLTFDRWQASREGTWEHRAETVIEAVAALDVRHSRRELVSVGGAR